MPPKKLKNPSWCYTIRDERSKWFSEKYKEFIEKCSSFLDVGCSEKFLKKYLPKKSKYVGLDIAGNPDVKLDLDAVEKLPFKDAEFDMVVCLDVLEHLENIHNIFDELCRVSKRYVVISLPNCWNSFMLHFFRLFGPAHIMPLKFYGLPKEPPVDRHKWFFNYKDAMEFVKYRAHLNKFKVRDISDTEEYYGSRLLKKMIKFIISYFVFFGNKNKRKEFFSHTLWFILEKE